MGTVILADVTELTTVKISELTEATSMSDSDVIPGVKLGETQKIQKVNLLGGSLPAGITTGDIVRYNSVSGAWEAKSEPFEFKGLVFTPALASLVETEGAIYYNSTQKGVLVYTQT